MAGNTRKEPKDWVSGDNPMTGAQESYSRPSPSRRIKTCPRIMPSRGAL
ncbi:DUF3072 domain-containing protein [Bradyrhizobium japonicum]|nr:DUF3072 domain-containing protein [Bradyrhizobium japonicum]